MPEFRKAEERDCEYVAALESKYIECPWSVSVLRETVADELSTIYLLVDGDEILGYGGLKMALDTAEVYNMAVDEKHRRKGYGALILGKLIDHALDCGAREMFLEVNEHNEPAYNLYVAHGFKISHVRKNYYKSGDAFVMRREI